MNESTNKPYTFRWPYLLAKGPNGELLAGNNHEDAKHVVVFDEQLQYSRVIGNEGNKKGQFFGIIRGIAIDGKYLYASDGQLNCIWKFELEKGDFVSQFGTIGTRNGQFNQPAGLLFSALHMLFVCDRHNHRIQVFQNENYFYQFGASSDYFKNDTLREPVDLKMNSNEQMLFITCWRSNTVQVFTPNGVFLREINTFPIAPFFIERPNGIFLTPDDRLLVASRHHVLIIRDDGNLESAIEGEYNNPKKRFCDCIGVVKMNDGKIVIADGRHGTNRLIVFQVDM